MAIRDEEGRFQIAGRMDDVINIAGHRISTAEIEDCVSTHSSVSESAVISIPHDIKGMDSRTLTLIRESWKKNPKRGTITERLLRRKNPERSIKKICICFCALDFFSRKHAR